MFAVYCESFQPSDTTELTCNEGEDFA
eukprot:COSAG01_NODE_64157_length_277_cov_1.162921_1_plen_26_part_10